MNSTTFLPSEDRVELADEFLRMRFERDGFLSDSDLLDAVDLFTTSVRADDDSDEPWVDAADHDALCEELYQRFFSPD